MWNIFVRKEELSSDYKEIWFSLFDVVDRMLQKFKLVQFVFIRMNLEELVLMILLVELKGSLSDFGEDRFR